MAGGSDDALEAPESEGAELTGRAGAMLGAAGGVGVGNREGAKCLDLSPRRWRRMPLSASARMAVLAAVSSAVKPKSKTVLNSARAR